MKYLLFAFSAILLDVIGSCRDYVFFDVSPNTVTLDGDGDSAKIVVKSNVKWKITVIDSWLDITPASGKGDAMVTVTAKPNELDYGRHCVIKIDGESSRTYEEVDVYQVGNSNFLTVDPYYLLLGNRGDSAKISVSSNVKWKITGSDSWLDISPALGNGDAVVVVTAQPNESIDSRFGFIMIIGGVITREVRVCQEGKAFIDD